MTQPVNNTPATDRVWPQRIRSVTKPVSERLGACTKVTVHVDKADVTIGQELCKCGA